jgi:hypothetical protein
MVLANVAPKRRHQGGGVVEGAVDVRRPGVDRSTVQVNIGRLTVDGLTITQDGEERVGHHRRARSERNGRVDDRDGPGLRVMERRGWERRGQRR